MVKYVPDTYQVHWFSRHIGCPKAVRKLPESFPKVAQKLARDINTEMVTKIVPVRAVDLSIGPFCTEFRCERFCDNDVFLDGGQVMGPFGELHV